MKISYYPPSFSSSSSPSSSPSSASTAPSASPPSSAHRCAVRNERMVQVDASIHIVLFAEDAPVKLQCLAGQFWWFDVLKKFEPGSVINYLQSSSIRSFNIFRGIISISYFAIFKEDSNKLFKKYIKKPCFYQISEELLSKWQHLVVWLRKVGKK